MVVFRKFSMNVKSFTAEAESNNMINYLDITIHRTPTNWLNFHIQETTFTDTIIPYSSNHPAQHKYAAIRFLYNRLNTYGLREDEYREEADTIRNIIVNNGFPTTHTTHHPIDSHPPLLTVKRT
jgi:hypothetical protein